VTYAGHVHVPVAVIVCDVVAIIYGTVVERVTDKAVGDPVTPVIFNASHESAIRDGRINVVVSIPVVTAV
jgi:hypothetical protein